MYKCTHCGIKINLESEPVNCPGCGNAAGFVPCDPVPELVSRICNGCEALVYTQDTTGVCPECGRSAVFTEPEDTPGDGLEVVDRYAGQPVKVDPDNLLLNDPETGFNTDNGDRHE